MHKTWQREVLLLLCFRTFIKLRHMTWIHFCFITIVLYGIHDIMLKHLSDTVNSTVASLAINSSAAIVLFVYWLFQTGGKGRMSGSIFTANTAYLCAAGISLGIATITFMNAFSRGGNLSIAVPVVYAGVIAICMFFGVLVYGETLNWRQLTGAGLAIVGIFLMSSPR